MAKKQNFKIVIKDEVGQVVDKFTVKSENNLMALLQGERVFMSKHQDYKILDCGMWITDETYQRDLTVSIGIFKIEKYFSIELEHYIN